MKLSYEISLPGLDYIEERKLKEQIKDWINNYLHTHKS